jgi:hypothetical protein
MNPRKDIASSLVLILFSMTFLIYTTRYPLETWESPGPAVFPLGERRPAKGHPSAGRVHPSLALSAQLISGFMVFLFPAGPLAPRPRRFPRLGTRPGTARLRLCSRLSIWPCQPGRDRRARRQVGARGSPPADCLLYGAATKFPSPLIPRS